MKYYDLLIKKSKFWKYYCAQCDGDFNEDEIYEHKKHPIAKNPIKDETAFFEC